MYVYIHSYICIYMCYCTINFTTCPQLSNSWGHEVGCASPHHSAQPPGHDTSKISPLPSNASCELRLSAYLCRQASIQFAAGLPEHRLVKHRIHLRQTPLNKHKTR